MKAITFIADGQTRIFHFTFPFFLKSDVVIEVDGAPATNYNLVCISNGAGADTPFCGGQVHFKTPPKEASVVTIRRRLPVRRIVDYQPTASYSATAHNQDMNYFMEILKDMRDAVDAVSALPTDGGNAAAIEIIHEQIKKIIEIIDELRDEIASGGDVDFSEIFARLDELSASIQVLRAQYEQLKDEMGNMSQTSLPDDIDYVVECQAPTADNNYTWYRKYKSGWVEQGGVWTGSMACASGQEVAPVISLPVEMADGNYGAWATVSASYLFPMGQVTNTTSVQFRFGAYTIARTLNKFTWLVCGVAA